MKDDAQIPTADDTAISDPSANESECVRLLRRGRVGSARVTLYKGKYWEIDFSHPAGIKNKRRRYYRRSATAAYRLAIQKTKEQKRFGALAMNLTSAERFVAVECFRLLHDLAPDGQISLLEVVKDYIRRHPKGGMCRTVDEVVEELVAKKRDGNRRERYVIDFAAKLKKFAAELPGRSIVSVTAEDLERILKKTPHWGPRTIKSFVSSWKVLFYYSMKRGYCIENPCLRLELPKNPDKEPVIASIETVKSMLAAAKGAEWDYTPYVAIGCFAGLRPDEMNRLDWAQVDFINKTIVVLSAAAKGRARRVIDMSSNLMAWIQPYRKESGRLLEHEVSLIRGRIRKAMKLAKWPHNIMRHSYASYHYGFHRNESLLMALMGHADDGRILHNHYRAVVQPIAAREFWEIYPA